MNAVDQAQRTALFYAARADRATGGGQAGAGGREARCRRQPVTTRALDAALSADADQAATQLRTLGAKSLVAHAGRQSDVGKFDAARPGRPVPWLAGGGAGRGAQRCRPACARCSADGADPDSRTSQGDTLLHVALHVRLRGNAEGAAGGAREPETGR